jgi:L-lactate dehydrogenase
MKVAIIGGGGLVGSCTAFALQCSGKVSDLCLIDANAELAEGHALDLLHGASLCADQRIHAGDMTEVKDSQVVVITAGLRRKPDESRLDLINRNVELFLSILKNIRQTGLRDNAYLIVVSNPVDVLTYLATQESGLPWQRVIGLGTVLDTTRFRGLIARQLQLAPTQVNALILGEHGDSMVPIWSTATVNGLALEKHPKVTPQFQKEVFEETKTSGAKVIKLKGGAGFAVGVSICKVVEAITQDYRSILPVSTLQQGAYGIRDVCLSVPTVLGCGGVRAQLEWELSPKEVTGLRQSASVLKDTISQVEARIGSERRGVVSNAAGKPPTAPQREIPRSAWQRS